MIVECRILSNSQIAEGTYRIVFRCPEIANLARAGQFVTLPALYPLDTWRRPFTIFKIGGDQLIIVYRVVGDNTRLYSELKADEMIPLAGPFGQPAIIDSAMELFILVAGGCGLAPLRYIGQSIGETTKARIMVIAGFPTRRHIFNVVDLASAGRRQIELATDDGSEGFKGTAVDLFRNILSMDDKPAADKIHVFTCGPRPMMKAVADLTAEQDIGCTVLLEAKMACSGQGACLGCTVETTDGLKHVCQDGPCFDARKVIWS